MKKILSLTLLAALSVPLFQCTKAIESEAPEEQEELRNTTLVSFTPDSGTKVSSEVDGGGILLNWEDGDKLHVYTDNGNYCGILTKGSGTNKFSGELVLPASSSKIFFIYAGKEAQVNADGSACFSFITEQYGRISGEHSITNNLALYTESSYFPGKTDYRGTMMFLWVISKLDLSKMTPFHDEGGDYITVKGQAHNIANITIGNNPFITYSSTSDGKCKLYNPSGEYYMLMLNESTSVDLTFTDAIEDHEATLNLTAGFRTVGGNGGAAYIGNNPDIHTTEPCAIYATAASSGGRTTHLGFKNHDLTEQGICWSTDINPTIDNCLGKTANYDKTIESTRYKVNKSNPGYFTGFMGGLTANTTYHVRAYVVNEDGTFYGEDKEFTTLSANPTFEYVDLGFSSGTCWATVNMGATNPGENGDMYMWADVACANGVQNGLIHAYKFYNEDDCLNIVHESYSKAKGWPYNPKTGERNVMDKDDAAKQCWGNEWRTPSMDECAYLLANTEHETCTMYGVSGTKYSSKIEGYTDKFIFIPGVDNDGAIWTGSYTFQPKGVGGSAYGYYFHYAHIMTERSDWYAGETIGNPYYNERDRSAKIPIRPVRTRQ